MQLCLIILFQAPFVFTATYQKPVADILWSERCKKNSYVLNDCNWCWCSENHHYRCKARVCEEVDIFGHFKDTIQEINVGMEGHGVWRSTQGSSCVPGVQYRRDTIHCICDEDGNWPNSVCRDLFRILYNVEIIDGLKDAVSQSCSPTKLYLVGCNVCFCPSTGKLDPNLCTNRTCYDNDPVLASIETSNSRKASTNARNDEMEIYAVCQRHKKYSIGCQKCKCLAGNRLICSDCKPNNKNLKHVANKNKTKLTLCSDKIGQVIKMDCNLCICNTKDHIYCTTRKCLSRNGKGLIQQEKGLILNLNKYEYTGRVVDAPLDDQDCVPGTTYKRDCNICFCKIQNGKKELLCTAKPCYKSLLDDIMSDCVVGSLYEKDCYICKCEKYNNVKHQICHFNKKCSSNLAAKSRSQSLDDLHGYCEPLHKYKKGCNSCKCLANGKIVKCTTKVCVERSSERSGLSVPITVDIVPLQQEQTEFCPAGYSYKVGCNLCFCLSNGNALCTTADCSAFSEHLEVNGHDLLHNSQYL